MLKEHVVVTAWARSKTVRVLALLVLVVLLLVFILDRPAQAPESGSKYTEGRLGERSFKLEIADTQQTRQQGLSGRAELGSEDGMLFVFPAPDNACIWMKDTQFNLDILWFDANKKLIYQQKNLAPSAYPQSFCPPSRATYVVEINPQQLDINIGDELTLQKQ